jgi:hypothetical protein
MRNLFSASFTCALTLLAVQALPAQTSAPARSRVMGSVTAIDPGSATYTVKTDAGDVYKVSVGSDTKLLRTEPGAKDLKNAQPIEFNDVADGDRILASGPIKEEDKTLLALRVIDMSQGDIAKKRQAEQQDWQKRGVAGVVTAKDAATGVLTLRLPSLMGEGDLVKVALTPKTTVKRYAPDSVKYADAKPSSAGDIAVNDQVRALGNKDEASGTVQAEQVVSGTFVTLAASVVSVDAAAGIVHAKNMGTGKPLDIKITPDSNVRRMPAMGAGGPGGMPGGMPGTAGGQRPAGGWGQAGGAAPAGGAAGAAGAQRAGGGAPGGAAGAGGARRGGDFSRFIEYMPKIGLDNLKVGETIVVASSKGGKGEQITAITLLAGADSLVAMAQMRAQMASRAGMSSGPSMGMNLDVMSMMPGQ